MAGAVQDVEMVPLAEGAQLVGMSWERVWRRVLRGELEGRKVGGKWQVSVRSLESLREREAAGSGHRLPVMAGNRS